MRALCDGKVVTCAPTSYWSTGGRIMHELLKNGVRSAIRVACVLSIFHGFDRSLYAVDGVYTLIVPQPQGYYQMNYLRPHDDLRVRNKQPSLLSGSVVYRHSFHRSGIADALFGSSSIRFAGSAVASRNPVTDVLADNVGLAQDFDGILAVRPSMQSVTFDAFYHLDLSCWSDALYVEIGLPLVYSRWNVAPVECIANPGALTFPNGYMQQNQGSATVLTARSIQQALSGTFFFGDAKVPWAANRLPCGSMNITRLSEVSCALGGVVASNDVWSLRMAALTLMPGGNKCDQEYLLTPIVGNADHWELGMNITAQGRHSWDEHSFFEVTIMGNVTHLFRNHQVRAFDLASVGRLSRYTLLEQWSIDPNTPPGQPVQFVYDNILISASTFTARPVTVHCPIQGDLTLQGTLNCGNYMLDGGYHFYGRAREYLERICSQIPCALAGKFFRVKGTNNAGTATSPFLTLDSIDVASGTAPAVHTHSLFVQGGYCWLPCWGEPALLAGATVEFGSYGPHHALSQWGVWTQFRCRF